MSIKKAIITGDWHLRKDVPICRPEDQDEWINFQLNIVEYIFKYSKENNIPIYHTGDLFHRSQPSYELVGRFNFLFDRYKPEFYKLAGNHDLPYHNFDNVLKSGWFLSRGNDLTDYFFGAFHFNKEPKRKMAQVIFTHQLIFKDAKNVPSFIAGKTAEDLLNEFPKAKWICTGDNHKSFHYEKNGRHVLNPGCLIRQSATEENYETGFYLIDSGEIKFIKIADSVELKTEHLKIEKERIDRINAFVEKVKESGQVSFSFSDNLNKKLLNKEIKQSVKDVIAEIKEEIGV